MEIRIKTLGSIEGGKLFAFVNDEKKRIRFPVERQCADFTLEVEKTDTVYLTIEARGNVVCFYHLNSEQDVSEFRSSDHYYYSVPMSSYNEKYYDVIDKIDLGVALNSAEKDYKERLENRFNHERFAEKVDMTNCRNCKLKYEKRIHFGHNDIMNIWHCPVTNNFIFQGESPIYEETWNLETQSHYGCPTHDPEGEMKYEK